jgi:hypothetical protein
MAELTRCARCGLSQLLRENCKRCGRPLGAREASRLTAPGSSVRRRGSRLDAYRSIWTEPRATIRGILADEPSRAVVLLAWFVGIADSLDAGSLRSPYPEMPWAAFVGLSLVVGPPLGFARIYFGGLLTSVSGRWLGGGAGREECRAALAWSAVPQIAGLLLWVPALVLFGNEIFLRKTPRIDASTGLTAALAGFGATWMVVQVWSAILQWKCLGEAHGFSAWRGFLASLFARLVFVVVLLAIVAAALALDLWPGKNALSSPAKPQSRGAVSGWPGRA